MNLIEQLGGYEAAKEKYQALSDSDMITIGPVEFSAKDYFEDELLEYRRQHNIFEVGDHFINYADDAVYTALSIDQNNRMHGKSGDKNVWTYFGRFGLRHATDEEIKAGKRLEVNDGNSN